MSSLPSGTVTFLFSDVEGSTRLWEEHPELMGSALAVHDKVVRSAIEDAGGYMFSTGGDAFSAAFGSPADALQAAIEAQARLVGLGGGETPIRVRMAVHTGETEERGGDYFGPVVNRTSRLVGVGHGGQVLVSEASRRLVGDNDFQFVDLGLHRLRDLSRPEHIYQVAHPELRAEFPALESLDPFRSNLPVQLTSFVGREEEVAELVKLLSASRLVTLTGVGGAGKTRLGVQTAAEVLAEYGNGVWLVELAPITDPARIVSAAMDVLGLEEKPTEDPLETTVQWLADKQILLIVDNCEHLIDPAARFVARVLGAGAGVSVLATSRERLGVPGEYPYQVRSLASPASVDDMVRATLIRYPAIRLFAERGELARPGWRLTSDDAAAVVQICRRLDGMPLAIELAAARLPLMSPTQIAEHLDDRFRLLTGGSRTVLPRQQTLEAAIDWSYHLLPEEEKILFWRLAVFRGGFSLEAAETVCGVDPLDTFSVLDGLGYLVDKSLVQAEERTDGVRYRMLETLRVYARQKLVESNEVEAMRHRHAEYFRSLAEQAHSNLLGGEEEDWFRRLDDELDNLRQTMSWALEATRPQLAQTMVGSLYRYFLWRWRGVEGREWAERAVEASEEPTPARARALLAAGTLVGDIETSMTHLDEAIELSRSLGIEDLLGFAINNRAVAAWRVGRWEEAEKLYVESLELTRKRGALIGISITLNNLSECALVRKDYELAISRCQEAVRTAMEADSEFALLGARLHLFSAYRTGGKLDQAEATIREAVEREWIPGQMKFLQGIVAIDRGEFHQAASLFREALVGLHRLSDPYQDPWVVQVHLWRGARLLNHLGASETSGVLLGAADASYNAKGLVRTPWEAEEFDTVVHQVREAIGDEGFEARYHQGAQLDLDAAFDLLATSLDDVV